MEKWYVATKKADFNDWAEKFGISPVLARIIRNRDITEEAQIHKFLYGRMEDCYSPWLLKDMEKAVDTILDSITSGERIRIIGDYDVDGICSSYILTKGLQLLGANVDTAIPHRIHDGYGLNENLIEEAHRDEIGLIVTCDNGIAASTQIHLAGQYGMKVVVTDHHEVPYEIIKDSEGEIRRELIPSACAVVDPKQEACRYPFSGICGAVVAYKVISALAEKTKNELLIQALEEFIEFAAFASVCDVMELRDENRIIVKEGLRRMRNSRNLGLNALMEVNQIDRTKLNVYHLGFVLGPCLNATGRLDTAKRALELLQSTTKVEAMSAAAELKELNESRKSLTAKGVEQAMEFLEKERLGEDKVLVVYLPDVHESLAGIIAGKVREATNHPVFVLTKGEEGVKGSGRSIENYHMYEAMTEIKHCFTKYGGHAMAAGLSLPEENVESFRREINANCKLEEQDFVAKIHIDVPMPLDYASEELVNQLELLEPFGVGNAKPLFAHKNLRFHSASRMGANKSYARFMVVTAEGVRKQLLYFGNPDKFEAYVEQKYGQGSVEALYAGKGDFELSIVYQLGKNTYRGNTELQFVMQNYC